MAGLTSTGFERKTQEEIKAELEASFRASLGPNINTTSASVFGQIIGILSAHLAGDWELANEVYDSQYPDSANDASLDAVCAITGTVRQAATRSTVTASANLDAATTLPAGSVASVDGDPDARFETLEDVT